MDEGPPIAYTVLDEGVPVFDDAGGHAGTVHRVLAAREQDIFHGLVLDTADGRRFVEAADVQAIHERGVDLRLDAEQVAALPDAADSPVQAGSAAAAPHAWGDLLERIARGGWRRR